VPRETIYWDKQLKPMTGGKWNLASTNPEYRRVAEYTKGNLRVLTEWLGLVHSHDEQNRPLIFRTCVYIDGDLDEIAAWYADEAEATAGHVVECLKRKGKVK